MKSMMTRSRSLCLPAGAKCMGGNSTFWSQQQQDTVRVVRVDTLQLFHFAESLTVEQLLQQLNVPHHCVFELASAPATPASSSDLSLDGIHNNSNQHPQRICKGPLLPLNRELEIGCLYFVKPLPTLLCKLTKSRRASPFSDNPYGRAKSDYSCCCASRHHWESTASSLQQPCFSTSLIPDTAAGRQTPPLHGLAAPPSRSPSVKRTWSALTGALPFLHHSKSAKRIPSTLEALDLVVQATVLAEENSSSVLLDIPASSSSSGCSVGKAVKAITSGWYSPSQIMRNTWKPELRGICERSASSRPQLHNGYSLESCSYRERGPGGGSSEEAGAGNSQLLALISSSGSDAYSSAITKNGGARGGGSSSSSSPSWPPPRPAAAELLDSCRTSSKKGSRWQRDLRGLAGFGGGFGGASVPSWR